MTDEERFDAVTAGIGTYGWDFFMVDSSRGSGVHAAPFHIECQKDRNTFAQFGSHLIPWVAMPNALPFSEQTHVAATKLRDLILEKIAS